MSIKINDIEYVTVKECRKLTLRTTGTIRNRHKAWNWKPKRIGNILFFKKSDVIAWYDADKRTMQPIKE